MSAAAGGRPVRGSGFGRCERARCVRRARKLVTVSSAAGTTTAGYCVADSDLAMELLFRHAVSGSSLLTRIAVKDFR